MFIELMKRYEQRRHGIPELHGERDKEDRTT
jgi:hypothetical protein